MACVDPGLLPYGTETILRVSALGAYPLSRISTSVPNPGRSLRPRKARGLVALYSGNDSPIHLLLQSLLFCERPC